ncbi:MAG: ribosome assembly cofactor RimP [Paludibacter sp. 47-17]|nr:MAG: ribosome assembly cofactor RimP [Paludibacter sp. 47-17]
MISKDIVNQLVEEYLAGSSNYLVDLTVTPDQRIIIEIDAEKGVSIDDCVKLNRQLVDKLSPEIEEYELEVSSAGITEPFKVLRQYQKNKGKEVEVLTREGKKLSGILGEASESGFQLKVEKKVKEEGAKRKTTVEEILTFNYTEIKTTKMIIRFK